MSVQAITYVLDHSEAAGTERLVLIAIANHACSELGECWPSVALLAREARCSERAAQYALRSLEHSRRIRRQKKPGPKGTTRWRMVFEPTTEKDRPVMPKPKKKGAGSAPPESGGADPAGVQSATSGGANGDIEGVQTSAPEPSEGTVKEPSAAANAAAASADAPDGSNDAAGSSSNNDDLIREHWGSVTAYLKAAGFDRERIIDSSPKLKALCRRKLAELVDVDWPVVTQLMLDAKGTPALYADQPAGVLAWALGQRGADARRSTSTGQTPPAAEPAVVVADPDSELGLAWAEILTDARQHIGDGAWDTWLEAIKPIELNAGEQQVVIGAPAHAASWIEQRLAPLLAKSTTRITDRHITTVVVRPMAKPSRSAR